MDTIIIITPANIEVEYRLANAGSRLAAFMIDLVLQMLAILSVASVVLFGIMGLRFSTFDQASGTSLGFVLVASFAIQFGYFIAFGRFCGQCLCHTGNDHTKSGCRLERVRTRATRLAWGRNKPHRRQICQRKRSQT